MCFLLTFDDQFNHINNTNYFIYTNNYASLCFIAEECWTSPVFFCTDVIYSSFSLRFIYYTFSTKGFYIWYKYNLLY